MADGWEVAKGHWQEFCDKWFGVTESHSSSLSLDPLTTEFSAEPSSIYVRDSYVTTFDTIWTLGMLRKGRLGVILTGQPGTGA